MGIIMRNNVAYSGSGGSETVELSMAEYEAREAAGAIDSDTWYLIYDATDSYNAKKVVYDNAESGMTARTVQGAIDELNSNLENLENNLRNTISYENGNYTTVEIAANTTRQFLITFSNPFNTIPTVNAIIDKALYAGKDNTQYASITVSDITHTSFIANVTNKYQASYSLIVYINWSAESSVLAE